MRTAKNQMPSDILCRPWNAKQNERRRKQKGHAHNVMQSQALEAQATVFRERPKKRTQAEIAGRTRKSQRRVAAPSLTLKVESRR